MLRERGGLLARPPIGLALLLLRSGATRPEDEPYGDQETREGFGSEANAHPFSSELKPIAYHISARWGTPSRSRLAIVRNRTAAGN